MYNRVDPWIMRTGVHSPVLRTFVAYILRQIDMNDNISVSQCSALSQSWFPPPPHPFFMLPVACKISWSGSNLRNCSHHHRCVYCRKTLGSRAELDLRANRPAYWYTPCIRKQPNNTRKTPSGLQGGHVYLLRNRVRWMSGAVQSRQGSTCALSTINTGYLYISTDQMSKIHEGWIYMHIYCNTERGVHHYIARQICHLLLN